MLYHATAWTSGQTASTPISAERFAEIVAARGTCLFAIELEEKFSLLIDNFAEFEMELLSLAQKAVIWPKHDHDASMRDRLLLDRRLVNLLTACRLYFDQTDHIVSGMFGNPSVELESAKKFKNELHSQHWGYRLLEGLRNHVQHAGLPIHKIAYSYAGVGGEGKRQVEATVIPLSLVRTLEENRGFNKKVMTELRSRGDEVDLRTPVREYVTCFTKVHEELRRITSARVTSAREIYARAIVEFGNVGDTQVPFIDVGSSDETTGVFVEQVYLGTDIVERLDGLVERNRVSSDFTRFNASNRDNDGPISVNTKSASDVFVKR